MEEKLRIRVVRKCDVAGDHFGKRPPPPAESPSSGGGGGGGGRNGRDRLRRFIQWQCSIAPLSSLSQSLE